MRQPRMVFVLLLAAPLSAYILYPLISLLGESLSAPVAAFRARNYGWDPSNQPVAAPLRALFHESLAREAVWGTLKLAVGTVLGGGAWGLALALLWWRREFPGRRLFALAGYAPIVLPPLVGTLAFFQLIGESGRVWSVLPVNLFSNFDRVLLMHAYSFGLYTYSFCAAALQDLDPAREEAARSLGGGTVRVFFAAVWPTVRGPLAAAGLLTFMAAAASFSAPYFLDNSGRYLTVEILRSQDDLGLQRGLTVALAVVALAVLPLFLWLGGFGARWGESGAGVKGQARAELLQARGVETWVRVALSILALIILLAPPLFVAWSAFMAERPGVRIPFERLTGDDTAALARSCLYGAVSAFLAVGLGVSIALLLRRAKAWLALPFEWTVMLAVALPGSVVAIALLSAFNGPSLLAFGAPLGGTALILILAYTVRTLPLAVRPARAALDALGPDVERASASLGASPLRTLWRVTLPGILPSLAAALLLCFVTGTGEFVASQLLYDSQTRPVSVQIGEHFRTDPDAAAALSFCLMVLSASAVGAGAWVQRRARK